MIVAAECAAQFESATAQLMSRPKVWLHGENTSGFERIDHAIAQYSPEPLTLAGRHPNSSLAHDRVRPVGEAVHEVRQLG